MLMRPRGATGTTSLSRPGCGACVIAAQRLRMFTSGQPHTYAMRAMVFAYSGCIRTPLAGCVTGLLSNATAGGSVGIAAGVETGGSAGAGSACGCVSDATSGLLDAVVEQALVTASMNSHAPHILRWFVMDPPSMDESVCRDTSDGKC